MPVSFDSPRVFIVLTVNSAVMANLNRGREVLTPPKAFPPSLL